MNPEPHPPFARSRRTQQPGGRHGGATLIEVLVAIVVLSVGLLGLAGLQMTGLQSNHSAYLRSQATLLAYDLADQMRARRAAALTGAFADNSAGDRATWDANVTSLLGPGAQGTLVMNGGQATITIRWNDNRGRIKGENDNAAVDMVSFVYRTEI